MPGKLKLPKGFSIELYAGQAGRTRARCARATRARCSWAAVCRTRCIYIVEKDGKREVKVLVSGLYRPNGLAYKDGTLYIAELSKISKIEKVEDNLDKSAEADGDL